ncbi:MAG TPA: hypothetical protein PLN54_00930 [Flavobacteriales bacterium]|nr:hypothetical protein [Flavobacteriales bacterium]
MCTWRTHLMGPIALFLLFSGCGGGAGLTGPSAPGFVNVAFDKAGLSVLLEDTACVWVRFYNARRNAKDDPGSVMAVAVNGKGKEYAIAGTPVHYRLSDRIVGSNVSYLEWGREKAVDGCNWMRAAGKDVVACDMSARVLRKMLSISTCNGILVTPASTPDRALTMRFAAATLSGGVARELTGPGTSVICGEPCPVLCSDDVDYVHDEP